MRGLLQLQLVGALFGLLVGACGPSAGESGDPVCARNEDPDCEPELTRCVDRPEAIDGETCDEFCGDQGGACLAQACAGNTYMLFTVCEDDVDHGGGPSQAACDEPIDWGLAVAVQCCCVGV